MKRVFHIARRVILIIVAVLVALVIGALLFARTDYARSRFRDEARAALLEQFGLEVSFREAEVEVLPPRGHILEFEVGGSDGEPLLTVDRLTVSLSPAALLAGRVEITEISIEEPNIRLVIEEGRIANMPALRRQEGGSSESRLADVGILAGTVDLEWRDAPGGPLQVRLEDANFDLTSDESGDTDVRLLVAGGSIAQGDESLPVELIGGRVMIQADEERALARDVRLRLGEVRLAISDATVGLAAPHDVDGNVELWLPLELAETLPFGIPHMDGSVHVAAAVSRQAGRLEAEGQAEFEGLSIGPWCRGDCVKTLGPHFVGDVTTSFSYSPDRIAASELVVDRVREGDGRILIRDLAIDLSDEELPIDAEVTLEGIELANVLIDAGLYASRVRMRVDGTATLAGRLSGLRLRVRPVNLRCRDFGVYTANTFKPDGELILAIAQALVRGKVVIVPGEVRLRDMVVAFGETVLNVNVDFGTSGPDKRWSLRAQSQEGRFNIEDVGTIAGLEFAGTGSIRATIQGPYSRPSLEGFADMAGFNLNGIDFGDVRGPINWRGTTLFMPGIDGSNGQSRYRFEDGRVELAARGGATVDGFARLQPVTFTDFVEMFNVESPSLRQIQGAVTGEARIAFRGRPRRWIVDVAGDVADGAYGEETFQTGEVDLTWDGGNIDVRRLVLDDSGGRVSAAGQVSEEGIMNLDLDISQLPIQAIESRPDALASASGNLRGELALRGTLDSVDGNGWMELSPVTYGDARFGPSRLTFDIEDGNVRGAGGLAGRTLRLDEFTLGLRAPWPTTVRGSVSGLEVTTLLEPGTLPEGMAVRVDGTVDAGVELRRRPVFSGGAEISSLRVTHQGFEVRNDHPIALSFQTRRVNITTTRFNVLSSALTGERSFTLGGWASGEQLDLELRGAVDLGFVPSIVDSVSGIAGTISVDCQIGGAISEPSIVGEADVRLDRLALEGIPYEMESLVGALRFSRNAVLLEDVTARLLGGETSIRGRVALSGLSLASYRLDMTVRDATLPFTPRSSAVANAAVSITSPADEEELPLVSGRVELARFRYQDDLALGIGSLAREGATALTRRRATEVRTFDPAADRIRFDVQLVGGGNLRIDNNMARADVLIDDAVTPFRLVGTNQDFSLLGRLIVERRGTVTFRNTQFEIERGILDFEDPYDVNPSLDFLAAATRRDWVISLQVAGTRRDPLVSLRSDPPLSEDDIAFLLTFGLTREETEQLGYGDTAMGAATEILSQITGLDDELTRLVPIVDEIQITTDYSSRTGRAEPRVRVARRLTDRVRLGGSAALSEHRDVEANVEVEITDTLSLEGGYGNDQDFGWGNIGGDFRWRIEF